MRRDLHFPRAQLTENYAIKRRFIYVNIPLKCKLVLYSVLHQLVRE